MAAAKTVKQDRDPIAGYPLGRLIIVDNDSVPVCKVDDMLDCPVSRQLAFRNKSSHRLVMATAKKC